jgi:hypothetical protein
MTAMHRGIRPHVASCASRAPLLSPWLSRSRCRSRPTPTTNPFESNTNPAVVAPSMIRAMWQHSRDTSTVDHRTTAGTDGADGAHLRG